MIITCSLDDFIARNTIPVIVDPFSLPIALPGTNLYFLPGAPCDLTTLRGYGFQLQSRDLQQAVDLSAGVGLAHILDPEGNPAGYLLSNRGYRDAQGIWNNKYHLLDEQFRGIESPDWEKRYEQAKRLGWPNFPTVTGSTSRVE